MESSGAATAAMSEYGYSEEDEERESLEDVPKVHRDFGLEDGSVSVTLSRVCCGPSTHEFYFVIAFDGPEHLHVAAGSSHEVDHHAGTGEVGSHRGCDPENADRGGQHDDRHG